jgi:hypothetical protein
VEGVLEVEAPRRRDTHGRSRWLPWVGFYFLDQRVAYYYYYYAVIFDPFLIIAITLCLASSWAGSAALPPGA